MEFSFVNDGAFVYHGVFFRPLWSSLSFILELSLVHCGVFFRSLLFMSSSGTVLSASFHRLCCIQQYTSIINKHLGYFQDMFPAFTHPVYVPPVYIYLAVLYIYPAHTEAVHSILWTHILCLSSHRRWLGCLIRLVSGGPVAVEECSSQGWRISAYICWYRHQVGPEPQKVCLWSYHWTPLWDHHHYSMVRGGRWRRRRDQRGNALT